MYSVDDCAIADVGIAERNTRTKVISFDGQFKCPKYIDKSNWMVMGRYENHEDTFSTIQTETNMNITRMDKDWGWSLYLRFLCCKG